MNFHASCVVIPQCNDAGIMITGAAQSGKSGLALQLMGRGALLISDDQILLQATAEGLQATAPEALRGLIAINGYGIVRLPENKTAPSALLRLHVSLAQHEVDRAPDQPVMEILSVYLPALTMRAHDPAAAAKIFAALAYPLLDCGHA